jgi:hypothetical protein
MTDVPQFDTTALMALVHTQADIAQQHALAVEYDICERCAAHFEAVEREAQAMCERAYWFGQVDALTLVRESDVASGVLRARLAEARRRAEGP